MASFLRFARQSSVPPAVLAAASFISSSDYRLSSSNTSSSCSFSGHTTTCEAPSETVRSVNQKPVQLSVDLDFDQAKKPSPSKKSEQPRKVVGFNKDLKGYFYHALPMSQVFQPKYDYPMWDTNWDNREPEPSGDAQVDRRKKRYLRKHGVTRHIILIRHGQYDETHKVCQNDFICHHVHVLARCSEIHPLWFNAMYCVQCGKLEMRLCLTPDNAFESYF